MTPIGLVPRAGLAALRAFGEQAERLEYPHIDVGGFIVPGRDPAASNTPGMEQVAYAAGSERWEQSPREEAGPSAGPRARSTEAAPGASPHTLEQFLTSLNLDLSGLVTYHPYTRVVASTETVVHLNIPIGMLRELPIRARLTLEIPIAQRHQLSQSMQVTGVPDVRAWAIWDGGAMSGTLVRGHHQNPDRAICACMPGQWLMGVNPLTDYVAFCILWVAKALHEHLLGFYPGPQHCTIVQRVERDRADEYCGCGKLQRYRDCCREIDRSRTTYDRWREGYLGRMQYLDELARQGRPPGPPEQLLRLGLNSRAASATIAGIRRFQ